MSAPIEFDFSASGLGSIDLEVLHHQHSDTLRALSTFSGLPKEAGGWVDPAALCADGELLRIEEEAARLRDDCEALVLVGVGGSKGACRAVSQVCRPMKPALPIIYAGDTLSSISLQTVLDKIAGRSVAVNVIAKNFTTLEPGLSFRLIRDQLERDHGPEGAARRIVCTGTPGDRLEGLAHDAGYSFFTFPENVGGRYSALSSVALLPLAIAGFDIRGLRQGAIEMIAKIREEGLEASPWQYALVRQALADKGFDVEALVYFEPSLEGVGLWWRQLFGESEGKEGRGIFPAICNYSEDLHSMGQYMQEGPKRIVETFLSVECETGMLPVAPSRFQDGFEYLDGKTVSQINKVAEIATINAHQAGHVPCLRVKLADTREPTMGAAFLFFEAACYASATLMGVNPFNQPGVEAYKARMFEELRK